jgi:malate dehydrogenase (oxaloacetate-decarboxylating)(NADP+)
MMISPGSCTTQEDPNTMSDKDIREASLEYHRQYPPGKIALLPTKQLTNQRDLALAYTPGVAAACDEIVRDPREAATLTSRQNLVAVVTNGTAVLGLGAIGPLAAKPVMEGKAVLFKKFSGLDCFDIEINELDPDKLVDMIVALEPTFGGINLEDIKAPECFYIERKCRERMKIPVFHDDQHGTAIIVGAAVLNGLRVVGKDLDKVKLVCSGAGAAALACLDLLVGLGIKRENIWVADIKGVVYRGRTELMDEHKIVYAQDCTARTLAEILPGADIFLGLSAARVLKPEWLAQMAKSPLILALANPEPEIMPDVAKAARPDAVIATGRSDFPNQVNNVLCFPFIFRGALDVGATTINEEMKLACVRAIADLAMAEQSDIVAHAYNIEDLSFGPEYLIPKPFDPRLIVMIAPAVAKAAMDSGVARARSPTSTRIAAPHAVRLSLRPADEADLRRGEGVAQAHRLRRRRGRARAARRAGRGRRRTRPPILIGRPTVIATRLQRFGLRIVPGKDFDTINPDQDDRYRDYWTEYFRLTQRKGVSQAYAQLEMRRRTTLIGAMAIHRGDADGMLCGMFGTHAMHRKYIEQVIGLRRGVRTYAAMNAVMLPTRTIFIADTYVNPDPNPDELAEITLLAAEEIRRFGLVPKVALLSHSSFGSSTQPQARKMQAAMAVITAMDPDLECEGEMHGDAALNEEVRLAAFPNSRLKGEANLLIMPTVDAANIAFNLLKVAAGSGVTLGPILLGVAKPAHILTPSATVRRIVNMTALTVVDATTQRQPSLL